MNESIVGCWRVSRIEMGAGSTMNVIDPALPGLFLFTRDHYSMTWMPGSERQPDYADLWHPNDTEKIYSYNAIVTNAGRYKIKKSKLVTDIQVAKTPAFIGGRAEYLLEIQSDRMTLEIVDNIAHDGTRDTAYLSFRIRIYLTRLEPKTT